MTDQKQTDADPENKTAPGDREARAASVDDPSADEALREEETGEETTREETAKEETAREETKTDADRGEETMPDGAVTVSTAGAPLQPDETAPGASEPHSGAGDGPQGKVDTDTDSDTDTDIETEAEAEAQAAPKPRGRALAALALLFAMTAVGGVGYLYYLLVYLQPLDNVRAASVELGEQYADLETRLAAQMQTLRTASSAALAEATAEQAERLARSEKAVSKSLNDALSAAPPSRREWKLAEAEYLLRIANHRVLMEQDSIGALKLLQATDQILAELDDFALYQVRARLADEIIALRQVPRDDLQGLYLRIEAVKSQLDDLPLPKPAYLQPDTATEADKAVWQTLLDELTKFVRVRSLADEAPLKPLLAPEEELYLELNLRLALEQAQLATLKRQQEVYVQSMQTVRRWFVDHADLQDRRAQALLQSVDELLLVQLARPLPEISGSLNELLSLSRDGA